MEELIDDNKEKITILYVDDEINNLTSFKANYRRLYNIHTAISADEGYEILKTEPIQVIITDQRMPKCTGIEFLERIIPEFPNPIRMLLTGYADIGVVIDAINKGQVFRYLSKPWNDYELQNAIENAFEVYRLRQENKRLTDELIAANKQLEFVLRQKLLS
jgi:response regulator RpfG family c-di-GMP phosphodiesterase